MTSKEALERLLLLARPCAYEVREHRNSYCDMLEKVVQQDLDRLEQLEKIFGDRHICEIKARFNEIECDADKCDNCPLAIGDDMCLKIIFEQKWEVQKENQELREIIKANFFYHEHSEEIGYRSVPIPKYQEKIKEVLVND